MATTYDEFGNLVEVDTTAPSNGNGVLTSSVENPFDEGTLTESSGNPFGDEDTFSNSDPAWYDDTGSPYPQDYNGEADYYEDDAAYPDSEGNASFDPSQNRLANAGLAKGGSAKTRGQTHGGPKVTFAPGETDWRLKISLAEHAHYLYKDPANAGIMFPLIHTGGVIFPYTPQVSVSHVARYGSQNLTHSNYTNYFYEGSEVQAITISGDFTVQNSREGAYLLACLYFFRAATKMFFGNSNLAGNPPPMVFLNGYGSHYFPNVPCVVTNFTHQMPQDVDYIAVPTNGAVPMIQRDGRPVPFPTTRVPTNSNISVTLQPIYSRANLYDNFSLEDFAAGFLIKGNGGYI